MPHLNARRNSYAGTLGPAIDDIPKAVLAAIAVSALTCGGDYIEDALPRVMREWELLHSNGIVPQRVPAKYRALANGENDAGEQE
jgi:hypothetical protein